MEFLRSVAVAIMIVYTCISTVLGMADSIFTIIPTTQYVWINQTATFTCATNISEHTVAFSILGVDEDLSLETLPGGGQILTATFTATLDLNGTDVTCRALDGDITIVGTVQVQIYVEGPPSLHNLTALQRECGIFISWEPPYLLPGLSVSYKVYINGEMIQDDISSTNHTYYPTVTSSTVYSISVVAYNESVGDGPPVDTMAHFNIATDIHNNMTRKLSPGNWTYQFTMPSEGICISSSTVTVMSCSKTNGVCYNASTEYNNVSVSTDPVNNTIVIKSNMTLPEDDLFDTCAIVDSDEQMIATDNISTSTHDLQGISVTSISVINATTSTLCLQFTLVDGATTDTVHVALECNTRPTEIRSYTNDDELVFTGCIDTVANMWRLSGCDGPLGDDVTCPNPAITTTIEVLHGTISTVPPVPTSTGIYTTTVPTTSSPVSPNTPTTVPTTSTGGLVAAVVGGVIGGLVVIVIIVIAILGMHLLRWRYWYSKKLSHDIPLEAYNGVIVFDGKTASIDNETSANSSKSVEAESSNQQNAANPPTIDSTNEPYQQNDDRDISTTEPYTTTTTSLPEDGIMVMSTYDYATIIQHDSNGGNTNTAPQPQYEEVTLKQKDTPSEPSDPPSIPPHPPSDNKVMYMDIGDLSFDNAAPHVMDEEKTIYIDTTGTLFPKSLSSKTVDDPPTQPELISILVPRLSSKWLAVGVELGLSPQQLEEVQDNRPDDRDGCLKDVLMMWEDNATDDKPYTWATMLHVLRSGKIGERKFSILLAKNLKK